MLGPVGRIIAILLVVLVAALAARAFFEDAPSPDETVLPAALPPPLLPAPAPAQPKPQPEKKVTIIDPDPDLDQNVEPADCLGTPEQPVEPKPVAPVPH